MSNTPRRQSKLFAEKSAASPNELPAENDAPVAAEPASETKAKPTKKPTKNLKKNKVSFYALPEDEARAEAAWLYTAGHTGHKSFTAFMEEAMNSYTRRLEGEYNNQAPFG